MVVGGPYSGGQSHHLQPLLSTCRMPLITRRSSTRLLPRTSVGKYPSIFRHCSSLSQNKLRRIFPAPESAAENHQPIQPSILLLGFSPSGPTTFGFPIVFDVSPSTLSSYALLRSPQDSALLCRRLSHASCRARHCGHCSSH